MSTTPRHRTDKVVLGLALDAEKPKAVYRRRKRAFAGATWTPDSVTALAGDGIWCRYHKMRHGYKSSKLGASYEKGTKGWKILWYCTETGNVLQEDQLGG